MLKEKLRILKSYGIKEFKPKFYYVGNVAIANYTDSSGEISNFIWIYKSADNDKAVGSDFFCNKNEIYSYDYSSNPLKPKIILPFRNAFGFAYLFIEEKSKERYFVNIRNVDICKDYTRKPASGMFNGLCDYIKNALGEI